MKEISLNREHVIIAVSKRFASDKNLIILFYLFTYFQDCEIFKNYAKGER